MTVIFSEDYTGPRWTYGLRNRPVARFNIPDGWIIGSQRPHPKFRLFGVVDYPHQLPAVEVKRYELEPVEIEPKEQPQ